VQTYPATIYSQKDSNMQYYKGKLHSIACGTVICTACSPVTCTACGPVTCIVCGTVTCIVCGTVAGTI